MCSRSGFDWPSGAGLRWAVVAVATVAACRAPPSQLPADTALRYGVGHMATTVSFSVKRDGGAEYTESDGSTSQRWRATLDDAELGALAATLGEHDLCSLTSSRSSGVPDEAKPTIEVQLGGVDCKVTLWDNEWSDDEDARACLRAVEELGRRIKERGEPVSE